MIYVYKYDGFVE